MKKRIANKICARALRTPSAYTHAQMVRAVAAASPMPPGPPRVTLAMVLGVILRRGRRPLPALRNDYYQQINVADLA